MAGKEPVGNARADAEFPGIALRPLALADFDAYYAIKCDPDDVRWSGFAARPDREGLRRWLAEELEKPDVVLLAAESTRPGDGMVGYVFVRRAGADGREAEISYGVAAAHRGRRFGQTMTALAADHARRHLPGVERAVCWIADDNAASIKNVLAAGYHDTGETRTARLALPAPYEKTMRKFVLDIER